jgi:hypothetical protein
MELRHFIMLPKEELKFNQATACTPNGSQLFRTEYSTDFCFLDEDFSGGSTPKEARSRISALCARSWTSSEYHMGLYSSSSSYSSEKESTASAKSNLIGSVSGAIFDCVIFLCIRVTSHLAVKSLARCGSAYEHL